MALTLIIKGDSESASQKVAEMISKEVAQNPKAVLGLATGSTYLDVYRRLASDREISNRDWSQITTFNLDEYVGLSPDNPNSYRFYMNEKLYSKVNIPEANTHVPSGINTSKEEIAAYEQKIKSAGGIDLQVLGLGVNGHIGFNEPGTPFDSRTRVVDLTESTIEANSVNFAKRSDVPTQAVSMGIGTILEAKRIILMALGPKKAEAIKMLLEGKMGEQAPVTALRNHPDVTVVVDREAASQLKLGLFHKLVMRRVYYWR